MPNKINENIIDTTKRGSPEFKNPNLLFSKTYPKINHSSDEEIRADRFAAELLMPSELFLRKYIKAMEAS